MRRWFLVVLSLIVPSAALAAPSAEPDSPPPAGAPPEVADAAPVVAHWTDAHPEASFALVAWVQKSPESARQIFWWDRKHPLRAQAFLRWVIDQPQGKLDDFMSAHEKWPAMDLVLKPNREAIEGLMVWARAHPAALQELTQAPRGFAWLGFHPMRGLWDSQAAPPADAPSIPAPSATPAR